MKSDRHRFWIPIVIAIAFGVSDVDQRANAQEGGPQSIQVVRTWQDLLDQPAIELKTGTARVGIDTTTALVDGAVVLYCLTDGFPTPRRWHSDDRIGPFHVEVHKPAQRGLDASASEELRQVEDTRQSIVLFRKTIPVANPGAFQILVKQEHLAAQEHGATQENDATQEHDATRASVSLEAKQSVKHPWMAFAPMRQQNFVVDEQFDAVTALKPRSGLVVPLLDGKTPLVFQHKGQQAKFAASDALPSLQPTKESLRLAVVGDRLMIESPRPITLNSVDERLLVRWWVNGKPVFNRSMLQEEQQHGERVVVGRTLLMEIEIDPADLNANFGDQIELQVMYCDSGWELVGGGLNLMRAITLSNHPEAMLSNRVAIRRPRAFGVFDAVFQNQFANEPQTHVVIRGDGRGELRFAARAKSPEHVANFTLPDKWISLFFHALRKTDFLQSAIKQKRALRTHPTDYKLSLRRSGESVMVDFQDGDQDELKAYRGLIDFLQRLRRQEWTLQLYSAADSPQRDSNLLFLNTELKALHGNKSFQLPHHAIMDWERFLPSFRKTLADRTQLEPKSFAAAARGAGLLKDQSAWEDLVWHWQNPLWRSKNLSSPVRDAIIDALVAYGGKRSVDVLAADRNYFHVSAWGLIRCGDVAVATIAAIIKRGPETEGDIRFETMFRTYSIRHKEIPQPVDQRIIQAVRESRADCEKNNLRVSHHDEFLLQFK